MLCILKRGREGRKEGGKKKREVRKEGRKKGEGGREFFSVISVRERVIVRLFVRGSVLEHQSFNPDMLERVGVFPPNFQVPW